MGTTTMKAEEPPLVPVWQMPRTAAAQEALNAQRVEQKALADRRVAAQAALDTTDPLARAEGLALLTSTELEFLRGEAAIAKAITDVEVERDADRVEARTRFHERKRPLVAKLKALLLEARLVNVELSALEVAEHEMTGTYLDPLAWPQLAASEANGTRTAFIDEWLQAIRARGFED